MTALTTIMISGASQLLLSPLRLVLWVLVQFSNTVLILLSPFLFVLYYAGYAVSIILFPFHFLARLESLYIFCGTAAVIGMQSWDYTYKSRTERKRNHVSDANLGISIGCMAALCNSALVSAFGLTAHPALDDCGRAQSGEHIITRASRRSHMLKHLPTKVSNTSTTYVPSHIASGHGKTFEAILEEDDEEDYHDSASA